jgi:hypothetical protein
LLESKILSRNHAALGRDHGLETKPHH